MKRIRIKKEIALVWAVTTNGHEEPLEGRNLSLFLVDPKYRKTAKTFHIENGNEVHFRVYPSEQPFTGVYTLELWENLGGQDQTVVDKRSAFELVNFTPQECDGSVDDIHAAEVFIGAGNLAVGIHGRGIVSVTKVSEDPNDWDYRILYDDGATEIIQIARGEKGLTDEEHAELIAETLAAKSAAQSANLAATLAASKAAEAAEAAQTATNAAEAANAAKEAADAATEAAQEATAAANAAKTAANNAATLANNAAANANTKAALAQAAADATNAAIAAASTATAAANAATAAANTAAEAANTAASTANSAASNASAKATLANNAATAANAAKDAANSAASAANAAAALANDAAARAEAAILTIENKIERVELVCEDDQHITRKGSSVALTYDEVKALVDEPKNFVTLRYLDMFWMLPSYDDGGAIMFTSSGIEFGHVVVTRVILNTDGQMNNYSIIAEDADHKTDDMSKETAMDGHMTYPTTHAVNLKLDDLQSKITELDESINGVKVELVSATYSTGTAFRPACLIQKGKKYVFTFNFESHAANNRIVFGIGDQSTIYERILNNYAPTSKSETIEFVSNYDATNIIVYLENHSAAISFYEYNQGMADKIEILNGVKVINAQNFGVLPNTRIYDAMMALLEQIGEDGAVIYLPKGNYICSGGMRWKSNVSLIGDGIGQTVLTSIYGTVFEGDNIENCRFENFTINGENNGATTTYGKGFFFRFLTNCTFRNLEIIKTGESGLGCDHFISGVIDGVICNGCGWMGTTERAYGCSGIGIGVGGFKRERETLTVTNCHAINCYNYGIFFEKQETSDNPYGISVIGCTADGNKNGFGVSGGDSIIFSACTAYGNREAGFAYDKGTMSSSITTGVRAKFNGCVSVKNKYGWFISNKFNGFELIGCSALQNSISGVHFASGIEHASIIGGEFASNTENGIYCGGMGSAFRFAAIEMRGSSNGFYFPNGADWYRGIVSDSIINGCVTGIKKETGSTVNVVSHNLVMYNNTSDGGF